MRPLCSVLALRPTRPLVRHAMKKGDKVGVAGIGGLGHLAIKLAQAKGAAVYAFTTTASKVKDMLAFGAKEAVFVDSADKLKPYDKSLDYMISTIPVNYDVGAYASLVKPYGSYTQELVDYCAENNIYPQIQVIKANDINEVWRKVVNKEVRYRYVIDTATV